MAGAVKRSDKQCDSCQKGRWEDSRQGDIIREVPEMPSAGSNKHGQHQRRPGRTSKKKVWQPLGFGDKGLSEALKRLKVEGTRPDCRCLRSAGATVAMSRPRLHAQLGFLAHGVFFSLPLGLYCSPYVLYPIPAMPTPPLPPSSHAAVIHPTDLRLSAPLPSVARLSQSTLARPHIHPLIKSLVWMDRGHPSAKQVPPTTATQDHGSHGRLGYKRRPATLRNPQFLVPRRGRRVTSQAGQAACKYNVHSTVYRGQYSVRLVPPPADVIAASATGDSKIACISPRQGFVEGLVGTVYHHIAAQRSA